MINYEKIENAFHYGYNHHDYNVRNKNLLVFNKFYLIHGNYKLDLKDLKLCSGGDCYLTLSSVSELAFF